MCNLIIFLINSFCLFSFIIIYIIILNNFGKTLFYFIFLYTSGLFFLFFSNFLIKLISYSPSLIANPWFKSKLEWLKTTIHETVAYIFFGFKRASVNNQEHKKIFINKRIDVVLNENQLKIFNNCFIYLLATFFCISFQKLFIEKVTSNQCITGYTCINKVFKLCGIINIQNNNAIDQFVCFKFDSNQFIFNIAIFYSFYKVYTTGNQFIFIIFYKLIQSYKSIFKKKYLLIFLSLLYMAFIFIHYFVYYLNYYKTIFFNDLLGRISFSYISEIFHFINLFLYFLTFFNVILTAEEISSNSEYIKNEMHLPLVEKISILCKNQKKTLASFISECKSDDDWKLLYKATINGFKSEIFHKKCDHYKNTLTIIKSSNGNVFGGYTTQSWTPNDHNYKSDKDAFIFSLENKNNKPLKIECNSGFAQFAIWCNKDYGPVFGQISYANSNQTTNDEEDTALHSELTLVSDILIDFKNNNYSTKVSPCYSNQYLDDLIEQNQTNINYLSGATNLNGYNFQILDIEVYWVKTDCCSCC